jgi:hypothetical protein
VLDLGNNPIGDEGAKYLLDLVKINNHIVELYLDETHVTKCGYSPKTLKS